MDTGATNPVLKVVLVGPSGAGKSTIHRHYMHIGDGTTPAAPTIGSDFNVATRFVRQRWWTLQLWDVAGQARFSAVTDATYLHATAIIGVVDLHRAYEEMAARAQRSKAKNATELMNEYLDEELERIRHALRKVENNIPKPAFVMLGNKVDLLTQNKIACDEVPVRNHLKSIAQSEMGGVYFDVSGLTGSGVNAAFAAALERAARVYEVRTGQVDHNRAEKPRPLAPEFPIDREIVRAPNDSWIRYDEENDEWGSSDPSFVWWRKLFCCI